MARRISALILIVAATLPIAAQRSRRFGFNFGFGFGSTIPYDGHFSLARLYYRDYPGWSFDWPEMEHNLGLILSAISAIDPSPDGNNIFRMDDPELMKHPVAYLSEPGYWFPTDSEAAALRTYLAKGGFLIVDDFHFENEWRVFEAAMRRVLPTAKIVPLDVSHPIFNSFFHITTLKVPYPGFLGEQGLYGEFYGIHIDNDPDKPLNVVIDYNMDIGDYLEWSGTSVYAVAPTNEAYKFMINYLVYGLTH